VRVAVVTGSGGLVGGESVRHFIERGFEVVGIDNDMRSYFFGPSASTRAQTGRLEARHGSSFRAVDLDIRDEAGIDRLFAEYGSDIDLVVHAAAQPSHDWAAQEPRTDFTINANGTLSLLESTRTHSPAATFIFASTNKVYGDRPNALPFVELDSRLDLDESHEYYGGIDTSMSIDETLHSLFGASKVAADVLVQEYGRYFGMSTVCFRGGCLTGPGHAGARLHGFLSYLMRCTLAGEHYTVYGYGGKQVRDNLHSADLVRAFDAFHASPRKGAVYNMGGGRGSNCSMLEAIALSECISGKRLDWSLSESARIGDHRWWISDLGPFQHDYPTWKPEYGVEEILREIYEQNVDRWSARAVSSG
jgi:CDP-paratose 2-epimerase